MYFDEENEIPLELRTWLIITVYSNRINCGMTTDIDSQHNRFLHLLAIHHATHVYQLSQHNSELTEKICFD